MALTIPPTITALPTPPSTSSPTTFDARADAFLGQFPTLTSETNAVASNVYSNAVDAFGNATSAATSAINAANSASAAAASSGAAIWVSGTTYAIGDARYSPANGAVYRRKTAGAGTTDPSLDTVNWMAVIAPPVGSTLNLLTTFGVL